MFAMIEQISTRVYDPVTAQTINLTIEETIQTTETNLTIIDVLMLMSDRTEAIIGNATKR
jgi:hypothetical protein